MTSYRKFGTIMNDKKAVERMNNRNQVEHEGMYDKFMRGLRNPRSKLAMIALGGVLTLTALGVFNRSKAPVFEDYQYQSVPAIVDGNHVKLFDNDRDGIVDRVRNDEKIMYFDSKKIQGPYAEGLDAVGAKRMTREQVKKWTREFDNYNKSRFLEDSLRYARTHKK